MEIQKNIYFYRDKVDSCNLLIPIDRHKEDLFFIPINNFDVIYSTLDIFYVNIDII